MLACLFAVPDLVKAFSALACTRSSSGSGVKEGVLKAGAGGDLSAGHQKKSSVRISKGQIGGLVGVLHQIQPLASDVGTYERLERVRAQVKKVMLGRAVRQWLAAHLASDLDYYY